MLRSGSKIRLVYERDIFALQSKLDSVKYSIQNRRKQSQSKVKWVIYTNQSLNFLTQIYNSKLVTQSKTEGKLFPSRILKLSRQLTTSFTVAINFETLSLNCISLTFQSSFQALKCCLATKVHLFQSLPRKAKPFSEAVCECNGDHDIVSGLASGEHIIVGVPLGWPGLPTLPVWSCSCSNLLVWLVCCWCLLWSLQDMLCALEGSISLFPFLGSLHHVGYFSAGISSSGFHWYPPAYHFFGRKTWHVLF